MRTNTALTLYNKYYNSTTKKEMYQRWVISKVMWENRKARNILASGGNTAADQAMIYIPFSTNLTTFLGPIAWLALADKTSNLTLQRGDLLVKGEIAQEVDDVTFTPTDLKAAYDDVLEISSIDTYDMGSYALRSWAIGAK